MEQKSVNNQLKIDYNVQLSHLKELTDYELNKWEKSIPSQMLIQEVVDRSRVYALDKLYTISGIL